MIRVRNIKDYEVYASGVAIPVEGEDVVSNEDAKILKEKGMVEFVKPAQKTDQKAAQNSEK